MMLLNSNLFSDTWNASTTYTVGQYCIYNNSLWKCLVQHSGQTPTEGTYWTKVSVANEITNVNNSLQASLSSLIKVKTVTGTTNVSGNLDLQTESSVKVISAICRTDNYIICEVHLNAAKTQWYAYLHKYDAIGAEANKTNTVDIYYIE